MSIVGYWPRSVALGLVLVFFSSHRLVWEVFPFSLSTAKLGQVSVRIGEARRIYFPRFAYSFVFFMQHQYYCRCGFYSNYEEQRISKIREKSWWVRKIRPASHISGGCDTVLIIISADDDIYYANIIGATLLAALYPCFQINLEKLIRNGDKDTITKR